MATAHSTRPTGAIRTYDGVALRHLGGGTWTTTDGFEAHYDEHEDLYQVVGLPGDSLVYVRNLVQFADLVRTQRAINHRLLDGRHG